MGALGWRIRPEWPPGTSSSPAACAPIRRCRRGYGPAASAIIGMSGALPGPATCAPFPGDRHGLETKVSGAIVTPGEQDLAAPPLCRRHQGWLAAAGMALVAVSLLPPMGGLARRYLFAESIQFSIFAMTGPALIAVGAPWCLLRLSRAERDGASGVAGAAPGPVDRLAARRRRQPSTRRAAACLATFIGVCLIWRLPPVLDDLARRPWLLAVELTTLLAAGAGLWLELVESPPLRPRLGRLHRAGAAALAMWFIWAVAYVLGFSHSAVVHAYDAGGGWLGTVADQEVTAGVLWAIASCCFMPVIFAATLTWLRAGDDLGEDFRRAFGSNGGPVVVRGWERSARRPSRSRSRQQPPPVV